MSDKEYFDQLVELGQVGKKQVWNGRRATPIKKEIAELVMRESGEILHVEGFGHTLVIRIAQVIALVGYALAVAMTVFALTLSVECVVSDLPARLWLVYAGGALAALLLGIVAHVVYDKL